MSLRVLVLCLHSSPGSRPGVADAGGMNVYVRHTCAELVAAGHQVQCLTLPRDGEESLGERPAWLEELPVLVGSVPKSELPDHLPSITKAALAAAGPADVVLAHYWISAAVGERIAATRGIPLVTIFHTTAAAKNARVGPDESPEPESRDRAERELARASTSIVVNTRDEADQLAANLGVARAKIHPVKPGIDAAIFHPADANLSLAPGSERDLVVGLAGRLQPLKGPQVLISALAQTDLPRLRAWIIGSGDPAYLDSLHQQVAMAGLSDRVEFLGQLDAPAMADRMRRADLWAVPSSSETFGLVAAEAQACGTPVMATAADGLNHSVLDGRTGWLMPDRDPQTWAAGLRSALLDEQELQRRAAAAARWGQSLTWTATTKELIKLLSSVVSVPTH